MTPLQILENNGLSKTHSRKEILGLFLETNIALTKDEIKQRINTNCDRATIYRNLKTFTNSGILHRVVANDLITRYVIKKSTSEHLHFKCEDCQTVVCLTNISPGPFELPEGFEKRESSFLVIGTCANCKKN